MDFVSQLHLNYLLLLLLFLAFNLITHGASSGKAMESGGWSLTKLPQRITVLYTLLYSTLCSLSHIVATVNTFAFFIFGVRPPAVM
jgi:hypothetical protein